MSISINRVYGPLVALALVTALPGAASAQNRPAAAATKSMPADTDVIKSITEADLTNLIKVEGHTIDDTHPFDAPSMRGKTKDGLLFVLIGTACTSPGVPGCQGIMMQVRYDSDERVTTEGINKANMSEAAVGTWWDQENKTVGFTRYVVLDDGVTWMNIRQNLRVLLSIQDSAQKYVFP